MKLLKYAFFKVFLLLKLFCDHYGVGNCMIFE